MSQPRAKTGKVVQKGKQIQKRTDTNKIQKYRQGPREANKVQKTLGKQTLAKWQGHVKHCTKMNWQWHTIKVTQDT